MRLIQFQIREFKRLLDTGTTVPGKMTVLLGPNETGKTSVLDALRLLSTRDPVPLAHRSRSLPNHARDLGESLVVTAEFDLADEDLASLSALDLDVSPRRLTINRFAAGHIEYSLSPPTQYTSPDVAQFKGELSELEVWLREQEDEPEEPWSTEAANAVTSVLNAFQEGAWQDIQTVDWQSAIDALGTAGERGFTAAAEVFEMLATWKRWADKPDSDEACWGLLESRVPEFKLFDAPARSLQSDYDINDGVLQSPPPALANLFGLAGLDPVEFAGALEDISTRATMLSKANDRLAQVFKANWKQGELSVHLDIDGTVIRVMIAEHDSGARSVFHERSEGLKIFVALVAFLRSGSRGPAILLIDEAETHLHYDAQADLIGTLMDQQLAGQVILTTHSPGCLPRDLGSGIRFVQKVDGDQSVLRHDFWSMTEDEVGPGFSPVLFAMGAGAATFSAVRRAVVVEGPSDMLLLPTMIRLATGAENLDYQVAQGLSVAAPAEYGRLDSIAPHVCYVTDGDAGGKALRKSLLARGVDPGRIFALPNGAAIEDLIEVDDYLVAFNAALDRLGHADRIAASDASSIPIKAAAVKWCKSRGIEAPSAVMVAEHMLSAPTRIKLTASGSEELASLHAGLTEAMGTR